MLTYFVTLLFDCLQATEALDQLLYLLKCDMDDVKSTAKEALMAFGMLTSSLQGYQESKYKATYKKKC